MLKSLIPGDYRLIARTAQNISGETVGRPVNTAGCCGPLAFHWTEELQQKVQLQLQAATKCELKLKSCPDCSCDPRCVNPLRPGAFV
jgi:hypothetical protein